MGQKQIIICDTNVIIEFYRKNERIINELQKIGQKNIAISVITAGELIYGAINKSELNNIIEDINSLINFDINKSISKIFINIMTDYSLSHNLTVPDGFIASTALVHDLSLFTLNKKDFKFIAGLDLYEF